MQVTDPIADMLTRIRNAGRAGKLTCEIPASNKKRAIADILIDAGYIEKVTYREDGQQGMLTVTLKYYGSKPVITGIKRISKPGLRVYADVDHLPRVQNGLGVAIISTSKGVMTDKYARRTKIGGEVLAYVW
ncbi:MAG: 30S ribosomal protein S8 [Clostridiaceae bacterium]|nr:30S ribosomal protein S8 [Clostridiaceae bacterium]